MENITSNESSLMYNIYSERTLLTDKEREEYTRTFEINTGQDGEELYSSYVDIYDTLVSSQVKESWDYLGREYVKAFASGEIPEKTPLFVTGFDDSFYSNVFHQMAQKCSYFAKVTKKVAKNIAEYIGPDAVVLDPLAGLGYFTKALREQGIPTIGTDLKGERFNAHLSSDAIEKLDAIESLKKYGKKVTHVIVSWAPWGENERRPIDLQILDYITDNLPGVSIIHVGESYGGCTGSDDFLDVFYQACEDEDFGYTTVAGLNDRMNIWNRG